MACAISLLSRVTVGSGQTLNSTGTWRMATVPEVAALPGSPTATTISSLLYGNGSGINTPPASYTSGTFAPGANIGSGPFLFIDPDNVAAGTYYLAYVVGPTGGCQDISIFTLIVQNGVDAGVTPASQTFCADDNTNHNVFNIIDNATPGSTLTPPCATQSNPPNGQRPCGVFSGTATIGAQWNSTNFTFNPSLAGVTTGTQNFSLVYTATAPSPWDNECLSGHCIDEISFTISVTAAGYAGENSSVTLCNSPN